MRLLPALVLLTACATESDPSGFFEELTPTTTDATSTDLPLVETGETDQPPAEDTDQQPADDTAPPEDTGSSGPIPEPDPTVGCAPGAGSGFRISIPAATIAEEEPGGGLWDFNFTEPDPVVCVFSDGTETCTPTSDNDRTANFGNWSTVVSAPSSSSTVSISLYDEDLGLDQLVLSVLLSRDDMLALYGCGSTLYGEDDSELVYSISAP